MTSIDGLRAASLAAILSLALGCAGTAASDLARVRSLSHLPVPAELGPVDGAPAAGVETLLAEPLSIDAAVRVAVLNNRALRATLRELGVERGMLIDARAVPNPTFEVELSPERNTEVELRVEYEISELILAPLRAKVARHELDAARYRAAAEVVLVGYRVRVAYRRLQAASERLAVAQRWLDANAAGRDAAVALEQAGSINQLEAASRVVGYERARVSVAGLELELAAAREALQRLLGLHGEQAGWTIAEALPTIPGEAPSVAELETKALEVSLELAADRSRIEGLADRTGLERTEGWLPTIAVDYHALVGDPQADGGAVPWQSGGGVSVAVPLFNQNRGKTRAAEAAFDGALERYIGATVDLRSRARELGNQLRSTHGVARHIGAVLVPAQRRVLDETLLQYNAMQLGVFELLGAEQALLEVELAELEARAGYWIAHAAFEALLAGAQPEPAGMAASPGLARANNDNGGH